MEVRKDEFPVVVQAYDANDNREVFVAEQVANSQLEIDSFTSRYSGKLIKARSLTRAEYENVSTNTTDRAERSRAGTAWIVILAIIVVLIAIGFATGWIQRNFNIEI